jgi:hypothetical protein
MTGSSDELLLAIDCGTQSVRALLIDLGGTIVAKRQQALENYSSVREGLTGARRRSVLAGDGRRLPGASDRTRRPQTAHKRRRCHHPARLAYVGRPMARRCVLLLFGSISAVRIASRQFQLGGDWRS